MRKDYFVVICIEHFAREFHISVAIRFHLQRLLNCKVVLVGIRQVTKYLLSIQNIAAKQVVLLVPFSYPGLNKKMFKELYEIRKDVIFIDLAYEQHLHPLNRVFRKPQDDFARNRVYHLAWSGSRRFYLEKNGVDKQMIVECIPLTKGLYEYPYKQIFASAKSLAERHKLDRGKKWILYAENHKTLVMNGSDRGKYYRQGVHPFKFLIYQLYDIACFSKSLKILSYLSNNTNVEVIFRPRPNSSSYLIQCALKRSCASSKIKIIKEGSLREWVLASDAVLSTISTSLIEADQAGKTACILSPYYMPRFLEMEWMKDIPRVKNYKEVSELVNGLYKQPDYLEGGETNKSIDPYEQIAKAIYKIVTKDKKTSFKRRDKKYLFTKSKRINGGKCWDKTVFRVVEKYQQAIFGVNMLEITTKAKQAYYSNDDYDIEEIQKMTDEMDAALGRYVQVSN